jgi:hypothetical protein
LQNRPDDWPRDGCDALGFQADRLKQKRKHFIDSDIDFFEADIEELL